jgi:hypothetical protein
LLAQEIDGEASDCKTREHARRIAEAEVDLTRIRRARDDLFAAKLESSERATDARPADSALPTADKFETLAKQLLAVDRYERRALSRRKFAIRRFDLTRQQTAKP